MDWSRTNIDTVKEILREGETYLQAQVSLATSADQRASVMASVFAAAGAAIVAGLITLAPSDQAHANLPIFIGGGLAALLFLAGAALCVSAALPVSFDLPGSQPESWYADAARDRDLRESLAEQAENYQDKIRDNGAVLRRNARRFMWGARAGIAAPFVGVVLWLLTWLCPALH